MGTQKSKLYEVGINKIGQKIEYLWENEKKIGTNKKKREQRYLKYSIYRDYQMLLLKEKAREGVCLSPSASVNKAEKRKGGEIFNTMAYAI